MERIAIISDIHGNLEALTSVLNDIEKRGITKIFCLGDIIAKGTNPSECLKLIREKCEVVLRGNCDEFFCQEWDLSKVEGISKKRIIWNKSMLNEEEQEYLLNLPFCYEFYMSGSLIRLFHATPTKIDGFVANIDLLEKKRSLFLPSDKTVSNEVADVIIYGHTHIQYLDRLYNKTLANVGSVGNPIDVIRNEQFCGNVKETTRANYLIIEGNYGSKTYDDSLSFQFIRVPYDIDKELNSDKINIEKEEYLTELREGKYRDMNKLRKSFEERHIDMNKF